MKRQLFFAAALCAAALPAVLCGAAYADEVVVMNIPYTEFYQAEMDLPDGYEVDAVSSATESVYRDQTRVGGSYSVEEEDGTHSILGVSFPVLAADEAVLAEEPFSQVADAEALAESGSYSYYIPEEAPAYYKELAVNGGAVSFGAIRNLEAKEAEGVTPVLDEIKGRRGDYKIDLDGFDFDTEDEANKVYAVIVKTADEAYPMRHLENIYEGNELAINAGSSKLIKGINPTMPENYTSIVGQTVTEIVYYTSDGIYTFPADIELPGDLDNKGCVLMNIPYDRFYEAEVTDASILDAVSSATMMKTRVGDLVGGSYHTDSEGSDISGVIYPVYVDDLAALPELGGEEITDDSSVEITAVIHDEEVTETYEERDALFEAPSYSWYVLQEGSLPKQYKKLTFGDEPSFGEINKSDKELEAAAEFVQDKHKDIVIRVTGAEEALDSVAVSAAVLTADDGTKVGMRHLRNIWQKYEIGFDLDSEEYSALAGKTITEIRYITENSNYAISVELPLEEAAAAAESGASGAEAPAE